VIALTADAMSGDRERFLALGANGYVTKPIDQGDLIGAVSRLHTPRPAGAAGPADPLTEQLTALSRPASCPGPGDALAALRREWLETACAQLSALDGRLTRGEEADTGALYRIMHDCQGQGPLFGYGLAGQIASDVCLILRAHKGAMTPDLSAIAIRYVRALLYCLENGISGAGGEAGAALRMKLAA